MQAGLKCFPVLLVFLLLHRFLSPPLSADDDISSICVATKLTHLDLAHNDITSEGVKLLGCPNLAHLKHLDLRNNAQVRVWTTEVSPECCRLTVQARSMCEDHHWLYTLFAFVAPFFL